MSRCYTGKGYRTLNLCTAPYTVWAHAWTLIHILRTKNTTSRMSSCSPAHTHTHTHAHLSVIMITARTTASEAKNDIRMHFVYIVKHLWPGALYFLESWNFCNNSHPQACNHGMHWNCKKLFTRTFDRSLKNL